jgi:hypothetical protein
MESWVKGGVAMFSPFSTTGVIIYKETDYNCQAIELMNLLHKLIFDICCQQERIFHIRASEYFIKFHNVIIETAIRNFELD